MLIHGIRAVWSIFNFAANFMEILGMRRISKFIVYIHFDLTK